MMASRDINDLCPELQPLAKEFLAQCASAGIEAKIDCTYRSNEEQDADYAKGVTHAKAGLSAHNCVAEDGTPAARAFDIYILNSDGSLNWDTGSLPWETAAQIGKNLGLHWGGDWETLKDDPHFQIDAKFP